MHHSCLWPLLKDWYKVSLKNCFYGHIFSQLNRGYFCLLKMDKWKNLYCIFPHISEPIAKKSKSSCLIRCPLSLEISRKLIRNLTLIRMRVNFSWAPNEFTLLFREQLFKSVIEKLLPREHKCFHELIKDPTPAL
jgi:hypothetical protein